MTKTSTYLYKKDVLLDKREIMLSFGKTRIDIKTMLKSGKLKPVNVDGRPYYKLRDILKLSRKFYE